MRESKLCFEVSYESIIVVSRSVDSFKGPMSRTASVCASLSGGGGGKDSFYRAIQSNAIDIVLDLGLFIRVMLICKPETTN